MERETISQQTHLDDQRKLMMALQALVNLEQFTVLAHLLAGEQSLLQLATELKLEPSLTRGPIGRLIFLELISMREEPGRIMCSLNRERFYALNGALQQFAKTLFAAERAPLPSDPAARRAEEDRRILASYVRGEELREIPNIRNERRIHVVLRWLANQFFFGRDYTEAEVNTILKRHHPDCASLRRYLVDFGYMARYYEVYRLLPATEWPNQ
jgi:hypothetical protein